VIRSACGRRLAAFVLAVTSTAACGKRGDPLPPLRPLPAQITDLAVSRSASRLQIAFTVPAANTDGSTPAAVDRVDVYAHTQPPGAPALTGAQLVAEAANLVTRLIVRPVDVPEPAGVSPLAPVQPRPGESVTVLDRSVTGPAEGTRYFVVVPVAGSGRGRPGPLSVVAPVPLADLPAAPAGISVTHDEMRILLSWQPAAAGQQFRVLRTAEVLDLTTAQTLTPAPQSETRFELPVEFGRQMCFSIQPLSVSGPVMIEGTPSPVQCLVPTDTYAPPVPTGLQAIQEAGGITLIWTAVTVPDLAGYVVLRGAADGTMLVPLFPAPMAATTYRDTTAVAGMTYTYAVYAVDKTEPPNASPPSEPQVVTVR